MAFSQTTFAAATTGASSGTTSGVDTTGADLLVVYASAWVFSSGVTISDSKSNSWTALTPTSGGGESEIYGWYSVNPTVGSGHTVTVSGTSVYAGFHFRSFSGADITTPFDVQNQFEGGVTGRTTIQPGSVTPSVDGELLVFGMSIGQGSISGLSVDNSFTGLQLTNWSSGVNEGMASSYLEQSTAAAINPQYSWTTSRNADAAISSYKAAAVAGGRPQGPFLHPFSGPFAGPIG